MRVVVQRVERASVGIDNKLYSSIEKGLLVLLGIEDEDREKDIDYLCKKVSKLRIFDDENGVMNLSVKDINGEILLVSQFTLHASTKKGNRPTYIRASKPDYAIPLYKKFISELEKETEREIKTGEFGADMKVELINDGPVTIIIDTKNPE
ncbi:MAG: D-aminoacyl-tRNA deacylase [Bacteroidales bacterium]|jgi:D-tyrosyl-tRNA(Tyr) deacylase|nr:D-aminoacyl-tRNA deacylase [Bacteroidales bacterium]